MLGVLAAAGYIAVKYLVSLLVNVDFPVTRDTIIASVVALLAALIIARSIRQSSRQIQVNQLHSEKAEAYRLFIDLRLDLLQQRRGPEERCTTEFSETRQTVDRLLALYGSSAVIKAHTALRALEREHGMQDPNVRSQLGKALMEMRKDLGSKTVGLRTEELLQLLVPESDTLSSTSEARDLNRGAVLAASNARS